MELAKPKKNDAIKTPFTTLSERRDSNPRQPRWQRGTLPLSYSRIYKLIPVTVGIFILVKILAPPKSVFPALPQPFTLAARYNKQKNERHRKYYDD